MSNPNGPYPGRQLFIGLSADGRASLAYLVTGRSPSSRERMAVPVGNGIVIGPVGQQEYDPLDESDKSCGHHPKQQGVNRSSKDDICSQAPAEIRVELEQQKTYQDYKNGLVTAQLRTHKRSCYHRHSKSKAELRWSLVPPAFEKVQCCAGPLVHDSPYDTERWLPGT